MESQKQIETKHNESAKPDNKTDFLVVFLGPNDQKEVVTSNGVKSSKQQIPIVPRNEATGWPLMQISLFAFDPENNKYYTALSGGKCHRINIAHYFFAKLLSEIKALPVSANITDNFSELLYKKEKLYDVTIPALKIEVFNTEAKPVFKIDGKELRMFFENHFFLKGGVETFTSWKQDNELYTKEEIQQSIYPEYMVYHDGQIYVDLGKVFKKTKMSEENFETFKNLFQVDQFNEVISSRKINRVSTYLEDLEKRILNVPWDLRKFRGETVYELDNQHNPIPGSEKKIPKGMKEIVDLIRDINANEKNEGTIIETLKEIHKIALEKGYYNPISRIVIHGQDIATQKEYQLIEVHTKNLLQYFDINVEVENKNQNTFKFE